MVAAICKLTAVIGGIDLPPKCIEQLIITDFPGIIYHLHGFDMRRPAAGNLPIGRIHLISPGIPRSNISNTFKLLKR